MPCPDCGLDGEPVLRKPRPHSREWEMDQSTFFGCPSCGRPLAPLPGPAANRPSDVPEDHLPDPAGLVRTQIQPPVKAAEPGARHRALEEAAARAARKYGLGFRGGPAVTLSWRGRIWLTLEIDGDQVVTR